MTPEELLKYAAEVKARADAATRGPWFAYGDGVAARGSMADTGIPSIRPVLDKRDNLTFIASARTDEPRLAEMVRVAVEGLQAMASDRRGPRRIVADKASALLVNIGEIP